MQTKVRYARSFRVQTERVVSMINYIQKFYADVLTNPCHNYLDGLAKLSCWYGIRAVYFRSLSKLNLYTYVSSLHAMCLSQVLHPVCYDYTVWCTERRTPCFIPHMVQNAWIQRSQTRDRVLGKQTTRKRFENCWSWTRLVQIMW